jgi:hypothetical protein
MDCLAREKDYVSVCLARPTLSHSRLISSSSFSFSFKGDPTVLKLSAEIGWKALRDSVEQMGSGKFTELVWPLTAEDPDDAFSSIPYEKVVSLCLSLCVSLSLSLSPRSLSLSLPLSASLSLSLPLPLTFTTGFQSSLSFGNYCWDNCFRRVRQELYHRSQVRCGLE